MTLASTSLRAAATLVAGWVMVGGAPTPGPAPAPAPAPKPSPSARARIVVEPIPETKPPQLVARCETVGLSVGRGGPRVAWRVGPAVHAAQSPLAPRDEQTLVVSVADPPRPGEAWIACDATDDVGATLSASTVLAPLAVSRVVVTEPLVRVEGAHLGATRGPDDAIVFVPARGRGVRADHACREATWSDAAAVACVPAGLEPGRVYEVRVQSGGRLGRAAGAPVLYTERAKVSAR
jgi:hypothetical protein